MKGASYSASLVIGALLLILTPTLAAKEGLFPPIASGTVPHDNICRQLLSASLSANP